MNLILNSFMENRSNRIYFKADGSFLPVITWVSVLVVLIIIDYDDLKILMITSIFWTVFGYAFLVLKFPRILLTNENLTIIYHPYIFPRKFIYDLNNIKSIELYYNHRKLRYHTTEIYINVDNIETAHTLGLANESALELVDKLNNIGINVRILDVCK